MKKGTTNNACSICGQPGIPGLVRGQGKCSYHWAVGNWGKAWADRVHGDKPGEALPAVPHAFSTVAGSL